MQPTSPSSVLFICTTTDGLRMIKQQNGFCHWNPLQLDKVAIELNEADTKVPNVGITWCRTSQNDSEKPKRKQRHRTNYRPWCELARPTNRLVIVVNSQISPIFAIHRSLAQKKNAMNCLHQWNKIHRKSHKGEGLPEKPRILCMLRSHPASKCNNCTSAGTEKQEEHELNSISKFD